MVRARTDLIDLMVSIMRNRNASTRAVELAAEVLAADARFNQRVGDRKHRAASSETVFSDVDFGEEVFNTCSSIRDDFDRGADVKVICGALEAIKVKIERRA